jgi:hypothetical protein
MSALVKQETRSLACPLSEEDFEARAKNLAMARQRARRIEAEKKTAVARFALELKDVNEEIDGLAEIVKSGVEFRAVTVEWQTDLKKGIKRLVRLDTNDVIDTKALTIEEKQATLNFSSSAAKAEAAAAAKNGNAHTNGNGEAKPKKCARRRSRPRPQRPETRR